MISPIQPLSMIWKWSIFNFLFLFLRFFGTNCFPFHIFNVFFFFNWFSPIWPLTRMCQCSLMICFSYFILFLKFSLSWFSLSMFQMIFPDPTSDQEVGMFPFYLWHAIYCKTLFYLGTYQTRLWITFSSCIVLSFIVRHRSDLVPEQSLTKSFK